MSSSRSSYTQHALDKSLLEPYAYIDAVPGKNIRGQLIDAFDVWMKVSSPPAAAAASASASASPPLNVKEEIKGIITMLHNSSLLVDDIEDNSKLRRGVPVAHSIFGVAQVINTANYMYFYAMERIHLLGNERAMSVFVSELLNLHRGQGQDILWRDTLTCPSFEQYERMVIDKTGGLFRLAVGLLGCFATENLENDYIPLVNNLALYFQIRDDLVNLASEEYFKSKSFCEDLTEGKFSFPIIHAVKEEEKRGGTKLLNILKQRTEDLEVKRYAQRLLRDYGSLDFTRRRCSEIKQDIMRGVAALGGHPALVAILEYLDLQLHSLGSDAVGSSRVGETVEPSATTQTPEGAARGALQARADCEGEGGTLDVDPSELLRLDST